MKKTIFAIFAHPDDESFGPGGTLALLSKTSNVILVYVTSGEACSLSASYKKNIADLRKKELRQAAQNLGVSEIIHLNFADGKLCNLIYEDVYTKLEEMIKKYNPNSLITFEPRGFSGHLDHIFVSSVTQRLYAKTSHIESLHMFAINQKQRQLLNDYYVYLPPGYHQRQINTIINISSAWEQKQKAIEAYQSQENDRVFWSKMLNNYKKHEHFISQFRSRQHPLVSLIQPEQLIKIGKSQ